MTLYVTPEKFRTMGFGLDLSEIEDFELASILDRAGGLAESYCGVSMIPVKHSFFGGEILADNPEQHSWRIPENSFDIGQRRIYPYHWPIREVTLFRIYVTNTQYVEIAPSEIFINNTDRYIEVISLAFTGVGLFGAILPSLGLMKPVAKIAYTYGHSFAQPEERLYPTDARTYRALNQHWLASPAPVVEVNGVVQSSGFTVDRTEGTVIFDAPQAVGAVVTVAYSFALEPNVRDGVGALGAHLLGERELAAKAMSGLQSIKVGEVTITRATPKLTVDNIDTVCPPAASFLAGLKTITIRA